RLKRSSEKQKSNLNNLFSLQQTSTPTADPSSLPVGEGWREGNKPQGLYLGGEGIRKDCHHSENALSPALPHGGGSGFRQIFRLQAV
ncbi:TPA: hypothetical protein ACHX99_002235, partial [Neisseria gonorrhoeae]